MTLPFMEELRELLDKSQKDFEEEKLRPQNLLHIYITTKIDINPHWEIGKKVKCFIDDDNIIIERPAYFPVPVASYKGVKYALCSPYKDDLELMLKVCKAELKNLVETGTLPEHNYFERVAILAHKQKNYQLEADILEMLIFACDTFEEAHAACTPVHLRNLRNVDVRDYVYYKKAVKRLEKTMALLAKQ